MCGHVLLRYTNRSRICYNGMHVQHVGSCIKWHIMQVDMYYWKICGFGGYIYHEYTCYGRTCQVGRHFLQVCADTATTEAAGVQFGCVVCFFSFLQ